MIFVEWADWYSCYVCISDKNMFIKMPIIDKTKKSNSCACMHTVYTHWLVNGAEKGGIAVKSRWNGIDHMLLVS